MTDDTTRIERAVRRVYEGEERRTAPRRAAPEKSATDYIKFLPLLLAVLAGYGGYVRLQTQVEALQEKVGDLKASSREQWREIGALKDERD